LALSGGDRVRVFSRNARDWTDRVPLIVEAILALPVTSATMDGEGVVVDERGVTDFERLRTAFAERGGSRAAFLYGFDVLEFGGEDLRAHPWEIRCATRTRLLRRAGPGIRLSEHLDGDGETILRHACDLHVECGYRPNDKHCYAECNRLQSFGGGHFHKPSASPSGKGNNVNLLRHL